MFKSKKNLLTICLFVTIFALGIGYATTTGTLKVNGTATALPNNSFKVFFTAASAGTATGGASSTATIGSGTNPTTATTTVSLTNLNESQTLTFTVKNGSETGIGAQFTDSDIKICTKDSYSSGTCTSYTSDYFTVSKNTSNLTSSVLSSGQTATFTIIVSLKKVNAGDSNVTENFDVVIGNVTPVQE